MEPQRPSGVAFRKKKKEKKVETIKMKHNFLNYSLKLQARHVRRPSNTSAIIECNSEIDGRDGDTTSLSYSLKIVGLLTTQTRCKHNIHTVKTTDSSKYHADARSSVPGEISLGSSNKPDIDSYSDTNLPTVPAILRDLTLTTQSPGCFLNVEFLQSASNIDTLQKHAADLAMKYPADLYVVE